MNFTVVTADGVNVTETDKKIIIEMESLLAKALHQVLITIGATNQQNLSVEQLAYLMSQMVTDEMYQMFKRNSEHFEPLQQLLLIYGDA